jgi:flagellar motor component MotA
MLFRTPVRGLFRETHQEVEQKLIHRIRLLIQKLAQSGQSRLKARKIEILTDFLRERTLTRQV